jgi:hypothetical protein
MAQAKAALDRIGSELIAERTENVMREMKGANAIDGDKTTLGRDLLSVISTYDIFLFCFSSDKFHGCTFNSVRSSLSGDPSQRLSHNEAICQIGTFLVAGHETTSNALTWTLYALARDQRVQTKLRAEISGFTSAITGGEDNDTLTPELLDAVLHAPYLDMVVREVLRVHAPVSNTMRAVATDRDAIPVQTPFTDRLGNTCTAIEVRRHDIITIPIQVWPGTRPCLSFADALVPAAIRPSTNTMRCGGPTRTSLCAYTIPNQQASSGAWILSMLRLTITATVNHQP